VIAEPLTAKAPTITMKGTGAAPKHALRYRFRAGATEYAQMDMTMSVAIAFGGRDAPKTSLPTIRTLMRIDAKDVSPSGDVRSEFKTEKVALLSDAKIDAKLREPLEKQLSGLVGMSGSARISSRGFASDVEFALPAHASPSLTGQLDTLRDAVRQMYAPLPEEEVGVGAKWDVSMRLPLKGAFVDVTSSYTLTKVDANGATSDIVVSMTAPPSQNMALDALPPGSKATLLDVTGKGTGTVTSAFSHLVGTGSSRVSSTSTFSVSAGSEQLEMKMVSDILVVVKPGAAPKK
jgi:hypothetical protein